MNAERAALLAALDHAKGLETENERLRRLWAAVCRDLDNANNDLASLNKQLSELTRDKPEDAGTGLRKFNLTPDVTLENGEAVVICGSVYVHKDARGKTIGEGEVIYKS